MNYAVILAAGSGKRMQNNAPKVLRLIAGKTVLWHTIKKYDTATSIDGMVLVVPKGMLTIYSEMVSDMHVEKCIDLVEGNDTRMQSAFEGLKAVDKQCDLVAIHDAARIMITPQDIDMPCKMLRLMVLLLFVALYLTPLNKLNMVKS